MYEIVGIYTLHKISNMIDKIDLGLYRDDGLSIFNNLSGPEIKWKKKQIIKAFKGCDLTITVTTNITTLEFLDITFDFKNGSYKSLS